MTTRSIPSRLMGDYAPLALLRDERGRLARAECSSCGAHDERRFGEPCPEPNVLKKWFVGWRFRTRATCPACMTPARPPKPKPPKKPPVPIKRKEKVQPAMTRNVISLTTEPKPKPEATDAAKKAKRLVYQALEDYYDDVHKQYRSGYSDETVAKETGASPEFVRSIREADFGPLGPPSELDALKLEVIQLGREVGEIIEKIQRLYKKNGWVL